MERSRVWCTCRLFWIPAFVIVVSLFLSLASSEAGKTSCIVPDESRLLTLLIENGGIVLGLPGDIGDDQPVFFHAGHQDIFKVQGTYRGDQPNVTPVDWLCPLGERPSRDAPINEISSCPWRYVLDRDPTRFPETIFHAVRRCGSCLDAGGAVVPGTRCEPVTYPTRVLRQRGCEPGEIMRYDVEDIEQTVAFQCVITEWRP